MYDYYTWMKTIELSNPYELYLIFETVEKYCVHLEPWPGWVVLFPVGFTGLWYAGKRFDQIYRAPETPLKGLYRPPARDFLSQFRKASPQLFMDKQIWVYRHYVSGAIPASLFGG